MRLSVLVTERSLQAAQKELGETGLEIVAVPDGNDSVSRLRRRAQRVVRRAGNLLARSYADEDQSSEPLDRTLRNLGSRLLHSPYQLPPWFTKAAPYVVTMHDLQELHYPQFFTAEVRKFRAINYQRSLEESRHVVVSFDHVKRDICRNFDVANDKVTVIPLPFTDCTLRQPSEDEAQTLANRFAGVRYLLYPAQTWEHKNHLALLKAFELLHSEHGLDVHLVLTGKQDSRFFPVLSDAIAKSPVASKVHLEGLVSEGALRWFYEHAALVAIPTKYEAGSFPMMEAMQLGAPVIASNVTSLPDTMGAREFLFDPNSPDELARLATKMLQDDAFREANLRNSRQRIAELSQDKSGDLLLDLWSRLAARH